MRRVQLTSEKVDAIQAIRDAGREGYGKLRALEAARDITQIRYHFLRLSVWHREAALVIGTHITDGAALLAFDIALSKAADPPIPMGSDERLAHVYDACVGTARETLACLIDILESIECAPDESDINAEIAAHASELQELLLCLQRTVQAMRDEQTASVAATSELVRYIHAEGEEVFLKMAHEELKPQARRFLEKHGPRGLVLLAKVLG